MKSTILATLFILITVHGFAQSEEVVVEKKEVPSENVVIVKKPKLIYEDSSEYHRMNKKNFLTAQLFGLGPSGAPATGLAFGIYNTRNSAFVIDVTGGSRDSDFWGSSYKTSASSLGLHFKKFAGNSFYFRTGVDQRWISHKYKYESSFDSKYSMERSFTGSSTAASFVIGNQWQWEGFTLGCDWIGITMPFASKVDNEYLSPNSDNYDQKRHEEDKKYFLSSARAQALNFYLGASF